MLGTSFKQFTFLHLHNGMVVQCSEGIGLAVIRLYSNMTLSSVEGNVA
jgi:hypothetical protein